MAGDTGSEGEHACKFIYSWWFFFFLVHHTAPSLANFLFNGRKKFSRNLEKVSFSSSLRPVVWGEEGQGELTGALWEGKVWDRTGGFAVRVPTSLRFL